MSPLLTRLKSLWSHSPDTPPTVPSGPALDGTYEELQSGRWPIQPAIPVDAFPSRLLLTEHDVCLGARGAKEILLAVEEGVEGHRLELLLVESDSQALGLALRIPTAANQFKEPYIVMEAEYGNAREDAVREIHFHLAGRLSDEAIREVAWAQVFARAAEKLDALRGRTEPH